jgi:hypothetical protein
VFISIEMADLEKLQADIGARINALSPDERIACIDVLHNKWVTSLKTENTENNISELLNKTLDRVGIKLNSLNYKKFKDSVMAETLEMLFLKSEVRNNHKSIIKIDEILTVLIDIENTVLSVTRLQDTVLSTENAILPKSMELMLYSNENYSKNTHMQNLIIFLSACLKNDKLKRIGETCYERVYTGKMNDEKRYDTKTWKEKCKIEEYIYSNCQRERKYDMWQNMTQCSIKSVVEHLSNCSDLHFTSIKKNRHVFSFSNGLYYACYNNTEITKDPYVDDIVGYKDIFIPYERNSTDEPLPPGVNTYDVTSSKYFNKQFNVEYTKYEDPFDIIAKHCPNFIKIMTYQKWDVEVQKWMCILIGRCMYDAGQCDNWQVIPFLLGQAGTGKSTICNDIVKMLYEPCDVSTMSSNMQTTFGLDTIADKFLFIAPEVKETFKLDQGEFQSMVSGEAMSLNRKFNDPKNIDHWKVPGFMAGNELFGYKDTAGSIPRRVIVFMFSKRIKKDDGDTRLGQKLAFEMPDIMLACNRLYLQMVNQYGSRDIWSLLPKYFHDNRENLAEATNALVKYFKSGEVVLGGNFWIRENTFAEAFKDYCLRMSYGVNRWNQQLAMGPFATYDIETQCGIRATDADGQEFIGTVYIGIDIRRSSHKDLRENIFYNDDGDIIEGVSSTDFIA